MWPLKRLREINYNLPLFASVIFQFRSAFQGLLPRYLAASGAEVAKVGIEKKHML